MQVSVALSCAPNSQKETKTESRKKLLHTVRDRSRSVDAYVALSEGKRIFCPIGHVMTPTPITLSVDKSKRSLNIMIVYPKKLDRYD